MEINEDKPKKKNATSVFTCKSKFKYKGKQYFKGSKIKLTKQQITAAKQNNII